jgi:hypothetical protein
MPIRLALTCGKRRSSLTCERPEQHYGTGQHSALLNAGTGTGLGPSKMIRLQKTDVVKVKVMSFYQSPAAHSISWNTYLTNSTVQGGRRVARTGCF